MVVEVVCLVILIRATIRRDKAIAVGERHFFGLMVTLAVIGVLALLVLRAVPLLGQFGDPIFTRVDAPATARYLRDGLKDTGAANAVASVILDYRGYDTLGEATILFAAVIGAVALLRRTPRKNVAEPDVS
jgi:multisubunit Na+/H+ antiporter MnhB subunit